jgi:NAD(P)-binding Rossmann-like domain
MTTIETDYLIIGAGASGMAFADSLIAESDADVVIVDRRHRPGGHWNDAYPFVRLHQPSAYYGVNSRVLGSDSIDEFGANSGLYERATGAEICDYFQRVLDEHLLPSGQVRFFGMCDYIGDFSGEHRFVSRTTGEVRAVRVRRKVVDATYLEPSVPSTHDPSFSVDPNVRLIPVNDLVALSEPGSGYTVIGAGKTAMDACIWLLDSGVAPETIRWIRPRDTWMLNRAFLQPLDLLGGFIEGFSLQLEAAAQAENARDLFRRLEACEQLVRLDPTVEPTMYHAPILSQTELESLRLIENVVRQGRVAHIGEERIELERDSVPTDPNQVYVDCTGEGIRRAPVRPIFEPNRITVQQVRALQPTFNAAVIAFVEAVRDDDVEKNRLCPPHLYPDGALDWLSVISFGQRTQALWLDQPDLVSWLERSRLNTTRGLIEHAADPKMQSAIARLSANREPAINNLEKLLAQTTQA